MTLETIAHQPFAHKFLRKLLLRLAFFLTFFVTFQIKIAGRIGGMNFIDKVNDAVLLTKFIFCINQDQPHFFGDFGAFFEDFQGVFFHQSIIFGRNNALAEDFFFRNIFIVAFGSFGCRCNDGLRETLMFLHTIGDGYSADFTGAIFVGAPRTSCKVAADDHLDRKRFAKPSNRDHRVWCGDFPVGNDAGGGI